METFKLIHVDAVYRNPATVLIKLWTEHRLQLANQCHVDSIPKDLRDRMVTLSQESRIILLNRRITRGEYTTLMTRQMFPFCSVYKNGGNISVLDTSEALRQGNYFLCHPREELRDKETFSIPDREDRSPSPSPLGTSDYRHHVPVEATRIWRNNPPYVNMDRTSDNIGGSSWDGNLVSWFQCGFSTRVQYAVHSGLFPAE